MIRSIVLVYLCAALAAGTVAIQAGGAMQSMAQHAASLLVRR